MTIRTNLLPTGYLQRRRVYDVAQRWGLVILAVLFGIGIDLLYLQIRRWENHEPLEALRAAADPLQQLEQKRLALKAQQSQWQKRQAAFESLLPTDDLLQTLGAIAKSVHDIAGHQATLESINIVLPQQPKATPTADLRAIVLDDGAAAKLLNSLQVDPRLDAVALRSSGSARNDGSKIIDVTATPRLIMQGPTP